MIRGAAPQPAGPEGRRVVLGVVRVLGLVVVVAFAGYALATGWDGVRTALGDLGWSRALLCLVVLAVSSWCLLLAWRRSLDALAAPRTALLAGAAIFFSSQVAKYVPGSVWPVVIQSEMGRRYDVPRRAMVASYAYTLVQSVAVAGVLSVLTLLGPTAGWSAIASVGATVGGSALVVALRYPRRFHHLLDLVLRKVLRGGEPSTVDARPLARGQLWVAAGWLLGGLSTWLLAAPFGAGVADLPYVVGASALAWVVGLVVLVVPAGAGVRELVLVLTLGQLIGTTEALTVAVVSRFLLVVVDVTLGGAAGLPSYRAHRRARGSGDGGRVERVT